MRWSDATAVPTTQRLREFALLLVVIAVTFVGWRSMRGDLGTRATTLAVLALIVGGTGLFYPRRIRWVYTGWMVVAFPIGWLVSHLMLALLFFCIMTPAALLARLVGRDALMLTHRPTDTYWVEKRGARHVTDYFRQY